MRRSTALTGEAGPEPTGHDQTGHDPTGPGRADQGVGIDDSPIVPGVVESARFRHVIGHLAGGVTIVTTAEGDDHYGMTASSVTSLSLEPPTLLCCLSKRSNTGQAVARTGTFAVNILEEGQADLAERFALNLQLAEKFADVALVEDPSGQPLLADALAHLVCRVRETVDGGTHLIFLSEVVRAETRPGRPLAYYRGVFGYFALDEDVSVRERLREVLLADAMDRGKALDPVTLAATLGAPATALHYALRELAAEGLLVRDPDAGYLVGDLLAHRADIRRARMVLELGALASIAGKERGEPWEALRRALDLAQSAAVAGHPTAAALHLEVHGAFVAPARSRALDQARLHLLEGDRTSAAPEGSAARQAGRDRLLELLALDRRAVEAAEHGDLPTLADALAAHLELEQLDTGAQAGG